MRIGKPESKDNLKFENIKVGETFRPKECWTEEDEKEIFIKIREICDNSGVYGGTVYNGVSLKSGQPYSFDTSISVDYIDAYIEEVRHDSQEIR